MGKGMLFFVVGTALSMGGLAQAEAPNRSAVMIVSSPALSAGFDQAMHDRLVAMGYDVTAVPASDLASGVFTVADADGYDVLLVSESISSSSADRLIGTTTPTMHNESYGWDNWRLTTATDMKWSPAGSSVDIVSEAHPITAMAGVHVGPMAFFSGPVSTTIERVSALAPGAELIAKSTIDGSAFAIVFAMEKGATLADGSASPARIAGFSIPGDSHYDATAMTDQAWALFEATIRWLSSSTTPAKAKDPSPADSATDLPTDVVLSWGPGTFAKTHDVYFGTGLEEVGAASRQDPKGVLVGPGQDANSVDPGRLEFGTTYYWRVDEVNAPPDSTVIQGDVWSFTVEPFARRMTADHIQAAVSSSLNADSGPEKTVDGSGLNASDQHDTSAKNIWTSAVGQAPPVWIQYEFDHVYKLHQMWGLGVKTATIEHSTDGTTWTALANVPEFAQAPGVADYAHNTTVDFGGAAARFVRMTCTSSWSGRGQYGLSEVRFFNIPVSARSPEPPIGATGVSPDTTLSWRAGREAAAHEVHLGTDPQAVADGTVPVATVSQATYAPTDLRLDTTYYWKVVEVNQAESPSAWDGTVWSFSTAPCVVVDDFEGYTPASPHRVFQAWIDGLGFSPDEFFPNGHSGNGTGSTVGHPTDTIMETSIAHGRQSMPLGYNGPSEATRTFEPAQDWTRSGITTLVLFFHGASTNVPGELYVKINDTKVSYSGQAGDLAATEWRQWNIGLPSGAGLGAVRALTIGVSAGQGTLYIDDIGLYRSAPPVGP